MAQADPVTITCPHWLPAHDGCPMGRPAPPILTEPEAMLLLRVESKRTMALYLADGLRHDRRASGRYYRLQDILAYMDKRVGG